MNKFIAFTAIWILFLWNVIFHRDFSLLLDILQKPRNIWLDTIWHSVCRNVRGIRFIGKRFTLFVLHKSLESCWLIFWTRFRTVLILIIVRVLLHHCNEYFNTAHQCDCTQLLGYVCDRYRNTKTSPIQIFAHINWFPSRNWDFD